jgi:hypothetical protein
MGGSRMVVKAIRDDLRDELVVPEWVSVKRSGTIAY